MLERTEKTSSVDKGYGAEFFLSWNNAQERIRYPEQDETGSRAKILVKKKAALLSSHDIMVSIWGDGYSVG
jgi:hypothetical protein